MSITSTYPALPIVKVDYPPTNLYPEVAYSIEKSGKNVTYQSYSANSYSLTNINFNNLPNNKNMIIPRRLLMVIPLRFAFVGGVPQIGVNDAPRAGSFANAVLNATARINGGSVDVIVSEIMHALNRYGLCKLDREKWASVNCDMEDFFQNYSDWTLYGSARNPLANIGENSSEPPRGGYPFTANNDGTYSYLFYVPFYLLSPFESYNDNNKMGFINIQSLEFNLQLGDFSRIWSHSSAGNAITAVNVSYDDTPRIIIQQITPLDTSPIPSLSVMAYNNVVRYVTNYTSPMAPGEVRTVVSQTYTPSQIPRRVMVYGCRQFADWTFNTTDTFYRILNINIQWNNQTGLLNTATEADLYRISCKNGYCAEGGYPAWSRFTGAVLGLNPGEDLSLNDLEANGLQEKFNVTFTITFQNISSQSMSLAFYALFVNDGILSINENGQAVTNNAILNKTNVLQAIGQQPVSYRDVRTMEGEGVFDKLKSFVNTGSKVVRTVADIGSKVAPQYSSQFKAASDIARLTEGLSGEGGRMRRRRKKGNRRRMGYGLVGSGINANDLMSGSEDEV